MTNRGCDKSSSQKQILLYVVGAWRFSKHEVDTAGAGGTRVPTWGRTRSHSNTLQPSLSRFVDRFGEPVAGGFDLGAADAMSTGLPVEGNFSTGLPQQLG